jgi:ABC-type antimicrobial peptide transport system permease subunit
VGLCLRRHAAPARAAWIKLACGSSPIGRNGRLGHGLKRAIGIADRSFHSGFPGFSHDSFRLFDEASGVFYLRYARSELARRRGRTIVTVSGLAVGVALVVVIAALTRGLDDAQATALNPLSSIGTDLTVTLAPSQDTGGGFGPGGGGGGRDVVQANSSVITDLSKLGKPGEKFDHTFFLPGTQLTFSQTQANQIARVDGVQSVSSGLVLSAVHQAGTVPKIVAQIRAGGQQVQVDRQIPRPTAAELQKMQTCLQAKGIRLGPTAGGQQGGGADGQGGPGGGLGAPNQQAGPGGVDRGAFASCLPERLRRFRATITTPEQTLRQVVDPPQTNISSSTYTIGGVDVEGDTIGIVTPSLVTKGRFLRGKNEALVTATYASRAKLGVGSTLDLNGTSFRVVGRVRAPLGGQTADVYVPLGQLQKLASLKGQVNVALVRASNGQSVADVQQRIETTFSSAQVASARDVADSISGSLVDASNLSHRLGIALAVLAALTAFLIALLLTLASVGKRVREIGTLKALGWRQRIVVRQIVGESLAQGIAGGIIGVVLGVIAAALIGAVGPTLSASSTTGSSGDDFFGLGAVSARTVTDQVALTAPVAVGVLALGFLVALLGGLVAGAAGGWRAARMRPADALRQVE